MIMNIFFYLYEPLEQIVVTFPISIPRTSLPPSAGSGISNVNDTEF